MSQDYIKALKNHDRSILDKAQSAPEDFPKDLDRALNDFDEEARELAIEFVALQDSRYSGRFLLRRLNDKSPDVAMTAFEKMESIINKPTAGEIIDTIPKVEDPFMRGKLYLEIGQRREEGLLGKLRTAASSEEDEEAGLQALAALVKLGGNSEFQKFVDTVRGTEPDDALQMQDLMLYIGTSDIAGGLVPWLGNTEGVMRIGGDRQEMTARMCDVAVWTAHLLKVSFPFETTHLRIFSDEELKQAEGKLKLIGK